MEYTSKVPKLSVTLATSNFQKLFNNVFYFKLIRNKKKLSFEGIYPPPKKTMGQKYPVCKKGWTFIIKSEIIDSLLVDR